MKYAQKICGLTTLLLLCSCFLFLHYHRQQSNNSPIDLETRIAIDKEVANFVYLCHLNELRADSFAQVVNKKYNYPYRLKAHFKVDNKYRREMFSIYDVKYYGMTDGYKGFIFLLHKMKVKEITVHWGGDDRFWTLYEWDLLDTDEIMGWEVDLNLMDIEIPEHEKVVHDYGVRVRRERNHNAVNQNEFAGFDGGIIR